MKTNIASRLSVRVKFKSFEQIEVCITDLITGEIQLESIPVILGKDFPTKDDYSSNVTIDRKQDVCVDDSSVTSLTEEKGEEVSNDTDGNEDGRTRRK